MTNASIDGASRPEPQPLAAPLALPRAARGAVRASAMARPFIAARAPDFHFGAGRIVTIAEDVAALARRDKAVLIVADAILTELGPAVDMARRLEDAGARVATFDEISGEPKTPQVDAIAEAARRADAGCVIGFGGGAALDASKLGAAIAATDQGAEDFALEKSFDLPKGLTSICVPTTAGTGAETTRTSVVSDAEGRKLWWWSENLLPDRAILDPELTLTLPPHLTAWTGLDAFVHALEAATNVNRSPAADLHGLGALRILSTWLPVAVREPENLVARSWVLWGAACGGVALHYASTAIAHCISHALGTLTPVHHGLATALAQRVALDWQIAGEHEVDGPFASAAAACGVSRDEFADWYAAFLAQVSVDERLPEAAAQINPARLAAEMAAPANAPMRDSTSREVAPEDALRFAERVVAMAA